MRKEFRWRVICFRLDMKKILAACAMAVLLTMRADAAPADELRAGRIYPTPGDGTYTSIYDIEYAAPTGFSLKLDLHIPDDPGPHPAILWLHTGAWISGDKSGGPALRQARRGYAVASVQYRFAPNSIFPAQLEDAKAAVRWLRANATRYNLDPDRIGVFGASAGGHLAALLGTTGDVAELEGLVHGNGGYSSRVRAVVDYYGPTDLLQLAAQSLPCTFLDPNASFAPPSLLIGCPIQSCPDRTALSNPIRYISPDDPPFLIVHGTEDCLVPWQQSQLLFDALRGAGGDVTLQIIPGAQHGGSEFDEQSIKQLVSDFLDRHLKGPERRRRPVRR